MPEIEWNDNRIEAVLSLRKLLKEKKVAYKRLAIPQPGGKLEGRVARIAAANVCELTSYDALLTVFWGSPQFGGIRDSLNFPLFVVAIDLLRVAEHLEARVTVSDDASRLRAATVSQIEVFRNAGIDVLRNFLNEKDVEKHWSETIAKIKEHGTFIEAVNERPHAWTRSEWDTFVSTYPDAAILDFAVQMLWSMIATQYLEVGKSQIARITRLYSEAFLAEMELENWKSNLLDGKVSIINSMVHEIFCGEADYETIFCYVYESGVTGELIRLVEDDVQELAVMLKEELSIDEAAIELFSLPAIEIVNRAKEYQRYVRNRDE